MFEIEFDTPKNGNPYFVPLMRSVRGTFRFNRLANGEQAHKLATRWGQSEIPGVRLRVDTDGAKAELIEPLNDPKYADMLSKKELRPAPNESFTAIHVPSYIHHCRKLVAAGFARVVAGSLPEIDGGEPQQSFISQPVVDKRDVQIDALIAENKKLTTLLVASLPAATRKELAGAL